MASCRTHKHAADELVTTPDAPAATSAEKKPAAEQEQGISAKLNFTAMQQGVKKASAGGYLRMKRDEIIQARLVALIVEIGRLEMTPEYILVQDRMNRQYVKVRWEDVPQLKEAGADFQTFQQLFWGEYPMKGKSLTLNLDKNTSLKLEYTDWGKAGRQRFPGEMILTIQSGSKNYGGIFKYSNVQADSQLEVLPTTISSSYKQVELDYILRQLTK